MGLWYGWARNLDAARPRHCGVSTSAIFLGGSLSSGNIDDVVLDVYMGPAEDLLYDSPGDVTFFFAEVQHKYEFRRM